MTRPQSLVVVLGTATEIGKTWVSAAVLGELRATGTTVAARKPAQSFEHADLGGTDAELLAAATGEDPHTVCPEHRWYETPMAPPMAADALGQAHIALADLIDELAWPDPAPAVGLVETAGGPCSPIAHDGDGIDLVVRLAPDRVLVVADAGLGTISAIRQADIALEQRNAGPPLVHLNRYDPGDDLHRRNRAWLEGDGFELTTDIGELAARLRGSAAPAPR
ncbi:MAG: dethiobiotin synthase [Acidimicrobiia bacterium]|nr:dethiobiotin synthase [Acidimicrobiia bacterium]